MEMKLPFFDCSIAHIFISPERREHFLFVIPSNYPLCIPQESSTISDSKKMLESIMMINLIQLISIMKILFDDDKALFIRII